MAEVTVGIDVATAAVRALAVSPDGDVVARAAAPLPPPQRRRAGWSEQQPAYGETVLAVLAELATHIGPAPVCGISVTATSGTLVPCRRDGTPVAPALLYDDRRATAEAAEVEAARRAAPTPPSPGELSAAARLLWLQRHVPAELFLHVSDVVVARLAAGVVPTDTSHALKTGADPSTARWRDVLDDIGVDVGRLPSVARPGTVVGVLDAAVARRVRLPAGAPLVLGMTDGCTGQIAAGAIAPGSGSSVLGTTLVVKSVARHAVGGGAVYSHAAPDGLWWVGGASNVGAGALGTFGGREELAALDELAWRHGLATVLHYPLVGQGERFPVDAPDALGFETGPPESTADAYRAVLEGVAFVERLAYETLAELGATEADSVASVGGASRSGVWLRIRSAVLGRPISIPEQPESGFGAAVLAAGATVHGGFRSAVERMVRVARVVEPDPALADAMASRYAAFLDALRSREWWSPPAAVAAGEPERQAGDSHMP